MRLRRAIIATIVAGSLPFLGLTSAAAVTLATPARAVDGEAAPTPIVSVAAKQYLPGEPTWPSSRNSSFALVISIAAEYATPGDTFSLELPPGLSAVAEPGTVRDDDGRALIDYRIDGASGDVRFEYAEAVDEVQDLATTVLLFANLRDTVSGGGTFTGAATSGDQSYPLEIAYGGTGSWLAGAAGVWVPSESTGETQLLDRYIVAADTASASTGGQWIGVRGEVDGTGKLRAVPGSTRVFHLTDIPASSGDLTAPGAAVDDATYQLQEDARDREGLPITGLTIPDPVAGFYVVEQRYVFAELGAPFASIPSEVVPSGQLDLHSVYSGYSTARVADLSGTSGGYQRLTFLDYYVRSDVSGSASPVQTGLAAQRDVTVTKSTATVTLTVSNTGNATLETIATDDLGPELATARIVRAAASTGVVATHDGELEWEGVLAPEEIVTITYEIAAAASGPAAGRVNLQGSATAETPGGAPASADVADTFFEVPALPTKPKPIEPDPEPKPDPESQPDPDPDPALPTASGRGDAGSATVDSLAETGGPAAPWALAMLLAGVGAALLLRGTRARPRRSRVAE